MEQFKIGDWLQVIAGHERPIGSLFKRKSCLTRYKAADVKLWEPNEGEWCWSKYDGLVRVIKKETSTNSYIVEPVALTIQRQLYDITGLEPFIGKLPSFI